MKIIFFGSSDYCLPVLESLNNHFNLAVIITKNGQAVEQYAKSHNVVSFTPKDTKELLGLITPIRQIKPDLAIVADYGLIIPKEIFTLPRYKTLNIHFSKLPKLRGPSPVQYTILLGEKSAWISVIIMDKDIDTGDIIWQKEITINTETSESLYKKLFNIIATELPSIIKKYINNELKPQKRDQSQATYTTHFTREDGFIPPEILNNAVEGLAADKKQLTKWKLAIKIPPFSIIHYPLAIDRACRALSPWPGVWTTINLPSPKRLKLLKVHLAEKKLIPDLVQLEGKKPVTWKQFQEGYPNFSF